MPSVSLSATKTDTLIDGNANNLAEPGETLKYTVTITNSGTMSATGLSFSDTIDANTTYVAGSLKATPIAANDSYSTIGNVNISVNAAQGLLANDFDLDGPLTIDSVNTAGTQGTVNVNTGDGSFTFNPNVAFQGTTSFTYTVKDSDNNTDTGTVTINVNGIIWFVDAAASNGDGRLSSPFNCIGAGACFDPLTDAQDTDNIFLYSGTYSSGLGLRSGQKLIGQGATQSILAITGLPAPSGASLLPSTGGAKPSIQNSTGNGITLTAVSNVLITGVEVFNPGDHGISADLSSNITITDSAITDNAGNTQLGDNEQNSLNFTNLSGTNLVDNVVFNGINEDGIRLVNSTGTLTGLTISDSTFSNHQTANGENGINIIANTSANMTVLVDNCTFNINVEGNMGVQSTTGSTATGSINITVQNSTFNAGTAFGPGTIGLNGDGTTTTLFKAINNTLNQVPFNGIAMKADGNSQMSSVITGNNLNPKSPSAGAAISVIGDANLNTDIPTANASIQNNTIAAGFGSNVVILTIRDSLNNNAKLTATINNNNVGKPPDGGALRHGIIVSALTATSACVRIAGNTAQGNIFGLNTGNGIRLADTSTGNFQLEQGAGVIGAGNAAATAALNVNNPASVNNTAAANANANYTVVANNTCSAAPMSVGPITQSQSLTTDGETSVKRLARHTLSAAGGDLDSQATAPTLTQYELQQIVRAAIGKYAAMGLPAEEILKLESLQVAIADLPEGDLADATTRLIQIDATAAGYGWFVDYTPDDNAEFAAVAGYNEYKASRAGGAEERMDLLTAIMREFAFVLGQGEAKFEVRLRRLSLDSLPASTRRLPQGQVIRVLPERTENPSHDGPGRDPGNSRQIGRADLNVPSFASGPALNLTRVGFNVGSGAYAIESKHAMVTRMRPASAMSGETVTTATPFTLPAGKSITLTFNVTINNPLPDGVCEVSNQGTVTADGGISIVTDDPDTGAANDATKTPIVRQPSISCPASQTVTENPPGSGSATVNYPAPTTTNNCGGTVSCTPASGTSFVVGTTTVTCTATNPANQTASCTFTVTVNVSCQVICPANVNQPNDPNQCGAVVSYPAPTTTGSCGAVTCSPTSGSFFPVGPTVVTCTAAVGSSCTFTVTVTDTQLPTVACPANIVQDNDPGLCTAVVTYAVPAASDNCPGATTVCAPAPGSTFNVGTTTVTCTATDASNNTNTCQFLVTVNDTIPPTISACPADITQDNDPGQCGAVVSYTNPTGSDTCSSVTINCTPASGSVFSTGTTNVLCTATDGSGLTDSCTFKVTVNDTQAPTIACPANITKSNDQDQCGAVVTYNSPTANDNCPGVTTNCSPATGSQFPVGTTQVTCTATDASGNQASCNFTVTVNDTQSPTITCSAPIVVGTNPNSSVATVTFQTTVSDNCPGVTFICTPQSGSNFPLGTTPVNCTATDASGNQASCSFTVTVNDNQPPTITCPPSITQSNTVGQCGAVVMYPPPTVTDNSPGATATCSPSSGSFFPVGVTGVTCTATDVGGNQSTCSFSVTVKDTQAPTILCPPNMSVPNSPNQCSATVNPGTATASDNCPGVTVVGVRSDGLALNAPYPVGTTTIVWTASDTAAPANQTSCTQTIVVIDTQAPTITITTQQLDLWPANHQYETVNVSDLVTSASDNCGTNLTSSVIIASISSDEPDDAPGNGDGTTTNDIVIAANCKSAQLRAEREGSGNGRVYTITFKVKDAAGNVQTATAKVTVPKSQGNNGAAVDNGPDHTVNGTCP